MAEARHTPADGKLGWPVSQPAPRRRHAWRTAGCVGLVAIAVAVVAIVSGVGGAPALALRVTSGSMEPTLAVGQVVHVDPSAYASAAPRIGDVIAFHAPAGAVGETPVCGVLRTTSEACGQSTPAESHQIFIKRVVGAPGDTIAVVAGSVVRNGVVDREPFTTACDGSAACNFPTAIKVPAGQWFLMGDDRGRSDDSRYWGPVPKAWIVGKVVK